MKKLSKFNSSIWFWQQMITPHMSELAATLAKRGYRVNYVANEILSKKRIEQGWKRSQLGKAKLLLAPNKNSILFYAKNAPNNSIHLCQGIRGNGLISYAQKIICKRSLIHWIMMEKIDDQQWNGFIKRFLYRIIFLSWMNHFAGILAIGRGAMDWYYKRGIKKKIIFPFAYFIKKPKINNLIIKSNIKKKKIFRFIFVGQLIKRKRVDMLIRAISKLNFNEIELWIVGNGGEKKYLKSLANQLLSKKKVRWFGVISFEKIPNMISQCDCLVLPSNFDGWGAVVSEALMVGTPVICSNKCGSSEVVKASKTGAVFLANNEKELTKCLLKQFIKGPHSYKERKKIKSWAKCLGADAGAKYLEEILFQNDGSKLIKLPWK
jgi:glycosyltransferase involved in cell wall biosynthesis